MSLGDREAQMQLLPCSTSALQLPFDGHNATILKLWITPSCGLGYQRY